MCNCGTFTGYVCEYCCIFNINTNFVYEYKYNTYGEYNYYLKKKLFLHILKEEKISIDNWIIRNNIFFFKESCVYLKTKENARFNWDVKIKKEEKAMKKKERLSQKKNSKNSKKSKNIIKRPKKERKRKHCLDF